MLELVADTSRGAEPAPEPHAPVRTQPAPKRLEPTPRELDPADKETYRAAAMETLAVIVYRQPIMKSDIEQVRGVDVSGVLKGLLDKNLVKIVGRKDVPGRPIIYGTTRKFLEVFNLRDLSDLPSLKEIEEERTFA